MNTLLLLEAPTSYLAVWLGMTLIFAYTQRKDLQQASTLRFASKR